MLPAQPGLLTYIWEVLVIQCLNANNSKSKLAPDDYTLYTFPSSLQMIVITATTTS